MNTPTYAVHGTWRPASPPADVDLEAQPITGTYALLAPPAVPAPAQTRTPHVFTTDAIGDLFGARPSRIRIRATCTSRHDAPPPYADVEVLPAYSAAPNMGSNKEPDTLAMYLFAFGFLFPPFWVLGAIALVTPLAVPEPVPPVAFGSNMVLDKSRRVQAEVVRAIRAAEVRWAQRCAWALVVLVGVVSVGVVFAVHGLDA